MTFNIETYLNSLPKDIETIDISNRYLTFIPSLTMFKNLQTLICSNNQLISLPDLNENLKKLSCFNNQLTSLPHLNEKLKGLYISDNPISEIINGETTNEKRIQIQLLNNYRHLYYSLKFKKQFRDWLWVKIREHKAMKKYNPDYLVEHLQEDIDLNDFLDNWV